jgi:hypothetical protein
MRLGKNIILQLIAISGIKLPEWLKPLLEAIAKNVYDIRTRERIAHEWTL